MPISARKRIHVLLIACLLFGMYALLAARLFHVQVNARESHVDRYDRITARSNHRLGKGQFERGRRGRFFDSEGRLLAGGFDSFELWIDPQLPHMAPSRAQTLTLPQRVEVLIGALLDLGTIDFDPQTLYERAIQTDRASTLRDEEGRPIRKRITSQRLLFDIQPAERRYVLEVMRQKNIDNFYFETSETRCYPEGPTFAEVVGYVGGSEDDHSAKMKGRSGLEYYFDDVLAGQDGVYVCEKDGRLREFDVDGEWKTPPKDGMDVGLTIDARMQAIVRTALRGAFDNVRSKGSAILAMSAAVIETRTGRILALKTYPDTDPEALYDRDKTTTFKKDLMRCRMIEDGLEPGSTIKPFIMARALEWGLVRLDTVFETGNGIVTFRHGKAARNVEDSHPNHTITAWKAITKSSNIAMSMIGFHRMGVQRVLDAVELFEFDKRLDVCMPFEARPNRSIARMRKVGKPLDEAISIPFGYAVLMPPLQIAAKFSVFGNGGLYPEPTLVDWIGKGQRRERQAREVRRLMPEHVAETMRRVLADVVEDGTAKRHLGDMPWTAAAKTGTAKITGSNPPTYNPSLVAFAPAERPDITVYVVAQKVQGSLYYGADVCGDAVREILEKGLTLRGVPQDRPRVEK